MNRKKIEDEARERDEWFERKRRETIELLHPQLRKEMDACATAMDMTWEEFLEHLRLVAEGEEKEGSWGYYVDVGDNEAYKNFDWNKIWTGYELITGRTVPPNKWSRWPGSGFNCSC